MKRWLLALLLASPAVAVAQEEAPKEEAEVAAETPAETVDAGLDKNEDGKVDKEETKALMEKEVSAKDVVGEVTDVVEAAEGMKGQSGEKMALAVSAFLAVLFKLLLSLVKMLSKHTGWFNGSRGKAALKWSTLGLGAMAALGAVVANGMGAGLNWMEIAMIGLSGPGSMVVHELSSLLPGAGKHAAPAEESSGG